MARLARFLPILLLAACGGDSFGGSFSGTYNGQPVALTLREDKKNLSGTIRWSGIEGQVSGTVEGDRAKGTVRGNGLEFPFEATRKDDTIVWTYDLTETIGQKFEVILTRGSNSSKGEAAGPGRDPQLVGRWYSEVGGTGASGNTVTTRIRASLGADGTFEYGGAESVITLRDNFSGPGSPGGAGPAAVSRGEWKTEGGTLYSRATGGSWIALGRYAVSGSDLVLYGPDGSKALWSRE